MKRLPVLQILGALLFAAAPAFASGGGEGIADPATEWDKLWGHILTDLFIIGGIFAAAATYMLFAYRSKSPTDVGKGPKMSPGQMIGWALIPAFVFMADDFYLAAKGWDLWNVYRRVPANALEVKVTGRMWGWDFQYENGVFSESLKVPAGRPVVLRMESEDVVHSFFLPKYRVKEDLMPGRITYLWFLPKEPGKTFVTCAEFCGAKHADMNADVDILPADEFNAWLESAKAPAAAAPAAEPPAEAAPAAPTDEKKI